MNVELETIQTHTSEGVHDPAWDPVNLRIFLAA